MLQMKCKNPNDENGSNALHRVKVVTDETPEYEYWAGDDVTNIDVKDVCI